MSKLANEMLRDIDKDTVDWDPNFDESRKEPRVLPSRFPNLLVNGSSGIAVGMATNIPPPTSPRSSTPASACSTIPRLRSRTSSPLPRPPTFRRRASSWAARASLAATPPDAARSCSAPARSLRTSARTACASSSRASLSGQQAYAHQRAWPIRSTKRSWRASPISDETDRTGMRIVIELPARREPAVVFEPPVHTERSSDQLHHQYACAGQ